MNATTTFESIDIQGLKSDIKGLKEQYATADPYPHIVIDNFLHNDVAEKALQAFPGVTSDNWIHYLHFNEKKHGLNKMESLPTILQHVITELNSDEFTAWLSELTGIEGLIADKSLEGGGLHQSQKGGFLNVHTDFTAHPHEKSWRRRVNVLVYLNKDWKDEYNGHLELWDQQMTQCIQRISPVMNRCVIFTTDDKSYHGHPVPLATPDDITRKSIALYYFTKEGDKYSGQSTKYKARPQDSGKRLLISLDNAAVSTYSTIKRKLGINDGFVSKVLDVFKRGK